MGKDMDMDRMNTKERLKLIEAAMLLETRQVYSTFMQSQSQLHSSSNNKGDKRLARVLNKIGQGIAHMDKRVSGDGEIEQYGLRLFGLWREPVVATLDPQNPIGDAYKRGVLFSLLYHVASSHYQIVQTHYATSSITTNPHSSSIPLQNLEQTTLEKADTTPTHNSDSDSVIKIEGLVAAYRNLLAQAKVQCEPSTYRAIHRNLKLYTIRVRHLYNSPTLDPALTSSPSRSNSTSSASNPGPLLDVWPGADVSHLVSDSKGLPLSLVESAMQRETGLADSIYLTVAITTNTATEGVDEKLLDEFYEQANDERGIPIYPDLAASESSSLAVAEGVYSMWRRPVIATLNAANPVLDAYRRGLLFSYLQHIAEMSQLWEQVRTGETRWYPRQMVAAGRYLIQQARRTCPSADFKGIRRRIRAYTAQSRDTYHRANPSLEIEDVCCAEPKPLLVKLLRYWRMAKAGLRRVGSSLIKGVVSDGEGGRVKVYSRQLCSRGLKTCTIWLSLTWTKPVLVAPGAVVTATPPSSYVNKLLSWSGWPPRWCSLIWWRDLNWRPYFSKRRG